MSCFNCPAPGIESAIAADCPEELLYPQDLLLLGRELLFGDQAPVFHHGELQNLRPLVVQASPGRGRSGLGCSRCCAAVACSCARAFCCAASCACCVCKSAMSCCWAAAAFFCDEPPIMLPTPLTATVAAPATSAVVAMVPSKPGPRRPNIGPILIVRSSRTEW